MEVMEVVDLDHALSALNAKQERESTWDESALHVSDLSLCKRQVWARRNALMEKYADIDNFVQMALGTKYEEILCAALDAAEIEYQYQVPLIEGLLGFSIVGTADYVFPDGVLDTKTTTFWTGYVGRGAEKRKVTKLPDDAKMGYRIQATAYAMGFGKPHAGVQSVCRATGKRATFWYDTSELAGVVGRAIVDMADTNPGDPEPVSALPPWYSRNDEGKSWQCAFCKYAACENNRNESLQVF